jgi:hypothetical protein
MELEMKMKLINEYRAFPYPSYNALAKKYGMNSWQVMYVFTHPTMDVAEMVAESLREHYVGMAESRKLNTTARINGNTPTFEEFWRVRDGKLVYDDTPEEAARKLLEMEKNGKQSDKSA